MGTAPTAASPHAASRPTRRATSTSPAGRTASAPVVPTCGSTTGPGSCSRHCARRPTTSSSTTSGSVRTVRPTSPTPTLPRSSASPASTGASRSTSGPTPAAPSRLRAGFNLGGIVTAPDRSALVVAQGNTGRLWRFDLEDGSVTEVDTGGADLVNADGLVLRGTRLTVVRNFSHVVTSLRLTADGTSARLVRERASDPTRVLTTAKVLRRSNPLRRQQVRRGGRHAALRGRHRPVRRRPHPSGALRSA